MVVGLQ